MKELLHADVLGSFIDNRFLRGKADQEHLNCVTQKPWKKLSFAKTEEIEEAIHSASNAFLKWKHTTAYERARLLRLAGEMLLAHKEELAKIMIAEMGKTIHEARGEVDYAVGYFTWFAGEAIRVFGQVIPSHIPNKHLWYEYRPVGVCGMITPWNFPLAMVARKIAPAIAAGCSTIVKPSPEAPCTVLALAEILEHCGFPPGLVNVLIGEERGIGEKILSANVVRKINFTGSTAVGQLLFAASAPTLKHTTMELGGLAPLIIFNDAQLDIAVDETIRAKFRNNGQACVGANRIFVQKEIYQSFVDRFVERVRKLKVGDPYSEETDITRVLHRLSRDRVSEQIKDALSKGAKYALKGESPAHPHVMIDCRRDMLPFHEETFGPLAPIAPFENEEEVLEWANETPLGLASYFFTQDASRARRVIQSLEFGIVGWNDGVPSCPQAPFGGVKYSGFGREGGPTAIYEYLEEQYISHKF